MCIRDRWNVGRTFFREQEVYNFNLVPEFFGEPLRVGY